MAFQFGVFEVDPRAGELRKHGVRIKLQEQPLKILLCLLENHGQVVTREQIQQKLWPDNTYVDYENAINSAIRKLREALNDSSDNPRFVETLPRRGYRFVAPVTQKTGPHPEQGIADLKVVHENPKEEPESGVAPAASGAARTKRWERGGAAALVGLIAAAAVIFWIVRENQAPQAPLQTVPLTAFRGYERYPSFSPDGNQVAFSWDGEKQDNFDIYVMQIGSGRPLRLTMDPAPDEAPAWSPDGKSIAFVRHAADKWRIMVIPTLGGSERQLAELLDAPNTSTLFFDLPSTSWSPDGRWLVVSGRDSPTQPNALWLVSIESGEKRRLTVPPASTRGDFSGAFSPDGRTVAFIRSSAFQASDVYVLPLAGDLTASAEPRRLTKDNRSISGISWTADGRALIFSSNHGGTLALRRMPVSGSKESVPLSIGENGAMPSISRLGKRLAYSQSITDGNIWRVNLTDPWDPPAPFLASTRLDANPQYSLDGKRIAFESTRSGNQEVWVSDADGSNPVQLVTIGRSGSPRWSPDGQRIAFDSNVDGHWQIYMVSAQGGRPHRMTTGAADDVRPSWSPDGNSIYFASNRSGGNQTWQVWRMPAGGGPAVQVTRHGGYTAFPSTDGKLIYFVKDDRQLSPLWKAPAEGGEESQVLDAVFRVGFAVTPGGIYYFSQARLQYLEFSTGLSKSIMMTERPTILGLTVSPDGHWLLYAQNDQGGSDLMLVENFR